MFERHRSLKSLRGFMVVAWLALLGGCLPHTNRVSPPPANLAASAAATTIDLTWTVSLGATGYNVKRSTTSGGPYTQLGYTTANTFTDSSVNTGTTYYYVVTSVAPDGESANSLEVTVTPSVPPLTPINLRAKIGDKQITLTWTGVNGATGYRVKRSTTSGGPYTQVGAPATASFVDTGLINGTTYFYVVSATNPAGESADSTQVSGAPDVQNPPPTTFGTWINVTPAGVDLTSTLCSNFGATTIQQDPAHPSNLYTLFHCQGVWKSTDYGATWTGPLNTGTNGAVAGNCSGGLSIPSNSTASVPTIYLSCIRGGTGATGFWRSLDGGVNWTHYTVALTPARQDYYPPEVDPFDGNHLLMAGHEMDSIVESIDGGQTWTSVAVANGMLQGARSPRIFFINTGVASTTRTTWLFIGDQNDGATGTWRTVNNGSQWSRVDTNEYVGNSQIYQPDPGGVLYMAGAFSALGNGVLRSRDYGQTWSHVGLDNILSVVFGSSRNVYSMYGFPVGAGGVVDPVFEVGSQPGTGTWVAPGTPVAMKQGPAQVAVVSNGTNNILVGAMWNSGVWRYVEP